MQFIFYFWSFEINRNIPRNQKTIIGLDSYILNSLDYLHIIWIYISHCMTFLLKREITACMTFLAFIVSSSRVTEEDIRNRYVLPTLFLLNVFTALKGTRFYILFSHLPFWF